MVSKSPPTGMLRVLLFSSWGQAGQWLSQCGDRLGDHGAPSPWGWAAGFDCQTSKQLLRGNLPGWEEQSRSRLHTLTFSLSFSLPCLGACQATFCSPPHFCSTASTCPHNPNPGLKTKQGWRGKKGQMDSTLLLRAWSNLHLYNSSSWDSQKNTFNISFFFLLFSHKTFFPQLGRALTMTSIAQPSLKPRSFQFCLFL